MVRDHPPDADQRHQNRAESIREYVTTRRRLIAGTASLGAAFLAGCQSDDGGDTPTDAPMMEPDTPTDDTPTDMPTDMPEEMETPMEESVHPDVDILNYALTLEHLEHAFYRDGLEMFAADEIMNADVLSPFGRTVQMEVPGRLETIRDHEKAHVTTISTVIEKLGGDPVGEAKYTFKYPDPTTFLATAKALENTGVAAYKGAAPNIKSNAVLPSALAVHSVEARHASFLNFLNNTSPFPSALGDAKSMEEVLKIADPFVKADLGGGGSSKMSGDEPTADRKMEDDTTDIDVLNYALTLEHLEYAFYRDGLKTFSEDDFADSDALAEFDPEVLMAIPDRLAAIRDHEKAHVTAITNTVEKLGGTPVGEAEYDFGYSNPGEFLGVAKALENTGVAAYAGAAPTVKNDAVFKAAAAIHDVEARHASFLNELNGTSPYPNAFDEAKTMDEVVQIASQFIVSN